MATDNSLNKRTWHTDWEFYYINEQIYKGMVTLHWIEVGKQKADILTKPLGPQLLEQGKRGLRMVMGGM
ncbi:hypothetical protein CROQUDRAFT_665026 [Cronartium quercuum f. sp. fusiforme G11]|uniref:Uncharacterized protein n=1 Tax=Cronartium quercuum f. sp. fusiforme G11 TaxID=708437 RepID=A0A9P6N7Q6_9BASI|nr:hypothetical protein CROQUDRAFT_665026 [Cronartium quercuum f. sp. fusiforme G11]